MIRRQLIAIVDSEFFTGQYKEPISLYVKLMEVEWTSNLLIDIKNSKIIYEVCYVFQHLIKDLTLLDKTKYTTIEDEADIFNDFITKIKAISKDKKKVTVRIWHYFSPVDWSTLLKPIQNQIIKTMTQRSVVFHSGTKHENIKFVIEDLLQVGGATSLKNKLRSFKLATDKKNLGDKYKMNMLKLLLINPQEYYEYSKSDVDNLLLIYNISQKFINKLARTINIKKFRQRLTIGGNINQLVYSLMRNKNPNIDEKELNEIMEHNNGSSTHSPIQKSKLRNVLGGRCNNENPEEFYYKNYSDVDIKSCYTNAMSELVIPISKFTYTKDKITIKDFLQIQNLSDYWVIRFSIRKLKEDQDFFPTLIRTTKEQDNDDDFEEYTKTIYLTREIKNSILTKDLLNVFISTHNPDQIEELMNTPIQEAIYYKKEDLTHHLKISELLHYLQSIKENTRDNTYNAVAKQYLNATYGVLSSKHIKTSNLLIANMITAKARAWIYILKEELGLVLTITDGGLTPYKTIDQYKLIKAFNRMNPLTLQEIEAKGNSTRIETTFKKSKIPLTIVFGKANYFYGNTLKLRGYKVPKYIHNSNLPPIIFYKDVLKNIAQGEDYNLFTSRLYTQEEVYKVGAYKHEHKSKGFVLSKITPLGFSRVKARIFRINNLHCKFTTIAEYSKIENKHNKKDMENLIEDSEKISQNLLMNLKNKLSKPFKYFTLYQKTLYQQPITRTIHRLYFSSQEYYKDIRNIQLHRYRVGIVSTAYIKLNKKEIVVVKNVHGLEQRWKDKRDIEISSWTITLAAFSIYQYEKLIVKQVEDVLINLECLTIRINILVKKELNEFEIQTLLSITRTLHQIHSIEFNLIEQIGDKINLISPIKRVQTVTNTDKNTPYISETNLTYESGYSSLTH